MEFVLTLGNSKSNDNCYAGWKPTTQKGLGLADVYLILLLSFNSKNVAKYRTHKSGGANTR
jgi:hypothetical protein